MGPLVRRAILATVLLNLLFGLDSLAAQEDYKAERARAIDLFNKNEHLQALPLFEDLVKKNPNDADVVVGLATCLVSHSSTLDDENAAAQERIRARALLLKAKELGNTSTLLENLLQTVPVDGVIHYSQTPLDEAMRRAEAAFARRDFDEAIRYYVRVLELDPKSYSATLFIGDTYFTKDDFAKASEWYERAARLDPNRETAYRYYSDMLIKHGEMDRARTQAIQAVVAEPYNPITWRALQYWARANKMELRSIHINTKSTVEQKDDKNITLTLSADGKQSSTVDGAWTAYGLVKTVWRMQDFKTNFPQETQYRHSLPEESQALQSAAEVLIGGEGKKKRSSDEISDPDLRVLIELYEAKMIEPYVLLNAADQGIAKDYGAYRESHRDKLETYLSTFIVPPAPAAEKK